MGRPSFMDRVRGAPVWMKVIGVLMLAGLVSLPFSSEEDESDEPERERSSSPPPEPENTTGGYTGRQAEIYDQQRGVCRTEQQYETPEYVEQDGANNPRRYAEYAARHGFYEIQSPGDLDAAIEGCLAGLKP